MLAWSKRHCRSSSFQLRTALHSAGLGPVRSDLIRAQLVGESPATWRHPVLRRDLRSLERTSCAGQVPRREQIGPDRVDRNVGCLCGGSKLTADTAHDMMTDDRPGGPTRQRPPRGLKVDTQSEGVVVRGHCHHSGGDSDVRRIGGPPTPRSWLGRRRRRRSLCLRRCAPLRPHPGLGRHSYDPGEKARRLPAGLSSPCAMRGQLHRRRGTMRRKGTTTRRNSAPRVPALRADGDPGGIARGSHSREGRRHHPDQECGCVTARIRHALEEFSLLALAALACTCLLDPVFTYSAAATVTNDAAERCCSARSHCLVVESAPALLVPWAWPADGCAHGSTKGLFVVVPFALVVAAVVSEGRRPGGLVRNQGCLQTAPLLHRDVDCFVGVLRSVHLVQQVRSTNPSSVVLHALLGFSHVNTLAAEQSERWCVGNLRPLPAVLPIRCDQHRVGYVRIRRTRRSVVPGDSSSSGGPRPRVISRNSGWNAGAGHRVARSCLPSGALQFRLCRSVRHSLLPLIGYVIVRGCRQFGIVVFGVALPVGCAVLQLAIGKY